MGYTRAGTPFASRSDTSYEAALHAQAFVSEQGVTVFRWLRTTGASGGTQKEAAAALGIARPSLCARFKALEDAGAIRKTAKRRAGCAAYVAVALGPPTPQLWLW